MNVQEKEKKYKKAKMNHCDQAWIKMGFDD